MRNSSVLNALFPQVRQGVLAATLGQPDKWWYLSELAGRLGTRPSSLQRELSSLVASGILVHRREGTRAYFKAETQSPVFRDLQQLFEKTAGLAPILEQVLKPFGNKIQSAFIYGSVARSQEHSMSDVDVMVIGRAGLADLSPALRKAEARLGREVNVTAYSPEEFREKIKSGDHFLAAVLRGRKQFVKGGQSDLDELFGKKGSPETQNLQEGIRQYAGPDRPRPSGRESYWPFSRSEIRHCIQRCAPGGEYGHSLCGVSDREQSRTPPGVLGKYETGVGQSRAQVR